VTEDGVDDSVVDVIIFNHMVKYTSELDQVFNSLADPIRRDILDRVANSEYAVGELVACYNVSFAAISKHLKVLEEACLIRKRKHGRRRMITLVPGALVGADAYLRRYGRESYDRDIGAY